MEITFAQKYLEELYDTGSTSDKKHRFQPQIVKRYIRVINTMRSVDSIDDLKRYNSLNYEKLIGDKKGVESVRVNDQYRIEFQSTEIEGEMVVTVCNILELSNHYS